MRQFLRHFFLPHHTNNHRAKALHPDSLLLYLLLFSILNLSIRIVHNRYPTVLGYATDIRVEQLLQLTNQQRSEKGLPPLVLNDKLSLAAAIKAQDMFLHNYWAHSSPQGKTPWDFILTADYQYTLAGENLAKNFSTSQGVMQAWMDSPTHRDNIIKDGYRDIGFAVVNGVINGEETTLVVQMLGSTSQSPAEQKPIVIVPETKQQIEVSQQSVPYIARNQNQLGSTQEAAGGFWQGTSQKILQTFSSVVKNPWINIPTATRDIVFLFLGFIIGILLIDGFVVYRKRLVRITGHTIAHIAFLAAIAVAISLVRRGTLI